MLSPALLMRSLRKQNWRGLLICLVIGFGIYSGYGHRKSRLRSATTQPPLPGEGSL
jgi:hypothetical protein